MKMKNIGLMLTGLCLHLCVQQAGAVDTLCAQVQIEVQQEATLIRQGFDAHMRINNGLPATALEHVSVTIVITDAEEQSVSVTSDTTDTNAAFFVRVDNLENIDSASNGTVSNSTSADLNWLIIPTLNAGVSNQAGQVFYVGATLTYTIAGKTNAVEVVPDGILVKPLPELALDYFLPAEVYGDDPGTTNIVEEVVPFSLGVRVKNSGYGTAQALKINSGQPEIVQNTNGLLVGFTITGTEVNGKTAANSLLTDFGTVAPGGTALARWTMECPLSGEFTEFSADITHADELGGEVTSLITETNTHFLVHDVLMDRSGRDTIRDFLTTDMNIYESGGTDVSVSNISSNVNLSGSGSVFTVGNLPSELSGPVYMKLSNPASAQMGLLKVVRSDGRQLPAANFWISLTRIPGESPERYLNLFDAEGSGTTSYTVYYEVVTNQPPQLLYIGSQTTCVNSELAFNVHASDPDGTVPSLLTGLLPADAQFYDFGNGHGQFVWTPSAQGTSTVWFAATDGIETNSETVTITVLGSSAPSGPSWWQSGVLNTNAGVIINDYAPVNQGQLKNIAMLAWDEMQKMYGGTNGTGGAGFMLNFHNATNYVPVNIGQAKAVAVKFYDRMGVTNYPWSTSTNPANDFAMANIGQIKNLFSFDPLKDSDHDGLPDWWEALYGLDPFDSADGAANRDAYFNNTVP